MIQFFLIPILMIFGWLNLIDVEKQLDKSSFVGPVIPWKSHLKSQAMPQPELFSAEKKEVRGPGHCFTTVGSQLWHSLDMHLS